jgi:predicted enzyme related to lactoylglutathione lyase
MSETATETSSIVPFELPAEDARRARGFYRQLFNRGFRQHEDWDYHLTDEGGGAVVGGTGQKGPMAYFGGLYQDGPR